jgi:hypothetical protein
MMIGMPPNMPGYGNGLGMQGPTLPPGLNVMPKAHNQNLMPQPGHPMKSQ